MLSWIRRERRRRKREIRREREGRYRDLFITISTSGLLIVSFTGSSDEDEDDIFSDDLVERGSDSDSGDNEQVGQRSNRVRCMHILHLMLG